MSRRHLGVELDGDRLRITDLRSTNGTTIDGVSIVDARCVGGEMIRIGDTTLRVERRGAVDASLPEASSFGRVIGISTEMRRLYGMCARLAASDVPVILEGETGTGKEVLAESLHEESARASGPFIVLDCTAIAPNLIESELFGHEKGAFTGATGTRQGVFEQADGGTLLIDEIGDLDLALQSKLLRVVERSEVRRVGGTKTIHVDVRILCATRRDLDRAVQQGSFRDDLFHRLAVGRIELPPLRKRKGDIPLLVSHFAPQTAGGSIPSSVLARWEDYDWPGNVRQLRNAVWRYRAVGEATPLAAASSTPSAGDFIDGIVAERLPLALARERVIAELERRYLDQVLARHEGDVAKAISESGLARRHFNRLRAKARSGA